MASAASGRTAAREPSSRARNTMVRSAEQSVALVNLGCSKNLVDGETIAARLESKGYRMVEDPAHADIILVNTCSFIHEATQEAIDTILSMAQHKKNGACRALGVAGCFSERYRDTAAGDLPEVDFWIGTRRWKEDLDRHFSGLSKESPPRKLTSPAATQYLKISEGCSHRCSFCVIPSIRGDFRSRAWSELADEANWLYHRGARELILVSQDTSFYGRDLGTTLCGLVEHLLARTLFPWIRMMYLHPAFVDNELLRLVAAEERVCSYFDMPIQHIADPVLRAMKRRPGASGIRDAIDRIRTIVPNAAIRTSLIVGFPGETEKHFEELVRFVEEQRFERLGVFPFSPEEGTPAAALRPRPRSTTATRRSETIMEVQRHISADLCAMRVGETLRVLVDDLSDTPPYNFDARTQWDAPEVDGKVQILNGDFTPGAFADVRISGAGDYDLYSA